MEKTETSRNFGISGSTLKLIAITAMLVDHIGATLVTTYLTSPGNWSDDLYNVYYVMRMVIGRIAFPIFCFLLTEGFQRTSNVKKYACRLGIFALVSEIPFDLAFNGVPVDSSWQNVFFTLFLGLLALIILRKVDESGLNPVCKGLLGISGAVLCMAAADLLNTDYGSYGVMCILVLYLARGNRMIQVAAGFAALWFSDAAIELVKGVFMWIFDGIRSGSFAGFNNMIQNLLESGAISFAMNGSEQMAPLGLLPVLAYNGKRGLKLKYVFYLFYPIHLFLLYLLTVIFL